MQPTNVRQSTLEALNSAWPTPRTCHVCGKEGPWEIPMVGEVRQYCDGVHVPGAAIIPLVCVTCSHCANTVFFNAIKLRLVDAETAKMKP